MCCIPQILFKCSILTAVEIALQVNLLVFVGGHMGFSSAFNALQYQTVPFNIISFIFKLLSWCAMQRLTIYLLHCDFSEAGGQLTVWVHLSQYCTDSLRLQVWNISEIVVGLTLSITHYRWNQIGKSAGRISGVSFKVYAVQLGKAPCHPLLCQRLVQWLKYCF